MFAIGNNQKICKELRNRVKAELHKLIEEYGKITFVDGEGQCFVDLAVGSLDRVADVYPDVQFIDADGVHCVIAVDCQEILLRFSNPELSTDDICSILDNARLIVNSEYEISVRGKSIGRQSYKALLLLDSIMEWGEWTVTKTYPANDGVV